ncbi:hypothetical protein NEMBOFW57_010491 [Staphylotrichum longicolle]|uniref:Uncharacterized protein n=1 Tax=Staphylotrichum longicolle TaxID=669026 RepID=A0AAD4HVB6_9PEZI|nr:hypothetical protein NEMBOFW57_010491 [Staphylotrichum longicolle]
MLGTIVLPDITIENVQPVLSIRPQRIYEVSLSDGRTVHLVLPPLSIWRPLRSEQGMLSSEAVAIRWIREALTHPEEPGQTQQQGQQSPSTKSEFPQPLSLLLPTLLHHAQGSYLPDSSFAVYSPASTNKTTIPLDLLSNPPSPSSQNAIDYQLGALFRHLASLTSPTHRFAILISSTSSSATIATSSTSSSPRPNQKIHRHKPFEPHGSAPTPTPTPASEPAPPNHAPKLANRIPSVLMEGSLFATHGAGTWSVAFHSMLEGVLRDGEDMVVVVPYSVIRRHFRRLGYLLDEVTVGRLVVVEAAGRGNLLVEVVVVEGGEEDGGRGEVKEERGQEEGGLDNGEGWQMADWEEGKQGKEVEGDRKIKVEREETEDEADTQHQQRPQTTPNLKLAGLRDWSSCVFGDPLFATVFSDPLLQQAPSTAFLEGFNGDMRDHDHHPSSLDRHLPFPLNPDIIEDVDTAWIRLLLYQVYHSVARIVGEFYRPRPDSSARELEARRALNEVLERLAEVPDSPKRRHRRPSGEMSPAKRIRGVEDGY